MSDNTSRLNINIDEVRTAVRKKYAAAAAGKGCGCGGSCNNGADHTLTGGLYSAEEIKGLPQDMLMTSLGCGNPTALGALYPGETVLDLGSGAGLDVLLSARRVGPYGKAYGLDMTDEMLSEANANKAKANIENAEFLKGNIEDIPLPDGTADVVISNCVINLSVDKDQVFKEIHRVLKPGGRIAVSDIVTTRPLPDTVRKDLFSWAGCISGALLDTEYEKKLRDAGFKHIEIKVTRTYDLTEPFMQKRLPPIAESEIKEWNGALVSAFIRAKKPAQPLAEGKDFSIETAGQNNFSQIHELLQSSGLSADGVDPQTGKYYMAAREPGAIMGVLGLEAYGTSALLRSLAVGPQFKKCGIAKELMEYVLHVLHEQGFHEIYLLTNTAAKYLSRYGFMQIDRGQIPADILAESALGCICPNSSTCMHLKL